VSALEVDPAALLATGRRLRAAVEVARDVRTEGRGLAALAADAGHDGLSDAVEEFTSRWSHGVGCLVEDAETLAGLLLDAGEAYAAVESSISRACGPR
jgi:hypothetical protein